MEKLTLIRQGDDTLPSCLDSRAGTELQSLLASVLTLKPNNGSLLLALMAAGFRSKDKGVTRHRGGGETLWEPGDAAASTNAGAVARAGWRRWWSGHAPSRCPLCLCSSVAQRGSFQVCPSFVGHGIGSYFHGNPEVWHHGKQSPPASLLPPLSLHRRRRNDSEGGRWNEQSTDTHTPPRSRRWCRGSLPRWKLAGSPGLVL